MSFEQIDHTADVGLLVTGITEEDLYSNAVEGLRSLMVVEGPVQTSQRVTVTVTGLKMDDRLINLLNELIYLFDVKGFIPGNLEKTQLTGDELSVTVNGEEFHQGTHSVRNLLKAATYHDLRVDHFKDGYRVTIIFDT